MTRIGHGLWLSGLVLVLAGSDLRAEHRPAPVPPTLEIEILDPNVDPVGSPAVIPRVCPDGVTRIDIPPTALVHRFYYTGDRSFQGPLLTGGPCTVVVNHPKTGERLYIPVQMLPGAPRVKYTSRSIEYDYGTQGITIAFCWLTGKPKVEYRHGTPLTRKVQKSAAKVKDSCKSLVARTSLPECKDKLVSGTKNVAVTTIDRVQDVTTIVLTPLTQAVQYVPGLNWFNSTPEERAERKRDAVLKRATEKSQRDEPIFLPTNR